MKEDKIRNIKKNLKVISTNVDKFKINLNTSIQFLATFQIFAKKRFSDNVFVQYDSGYKAENRSKLVILKKTLFIYKKHIRCWLKKLFNLFRLLFVDKKELIFYFNF